MLREKLTAERIRRFTCPAGKQQAFLFDTEAPRLAVRVTAAGSKAYVYEGKLDRATIRISLGKVSNRNTIDEVRTAARALQALVDNGIDPRQKKRDEKAAKAAAIEATERKASFTVSALLDTYADWLEARKKTESARQARSAFKCHVTDAHPELAAKPADELTSKEAATIIRKVSEAGKKRMAGILRSYMSAAYTCALKAELDPSLPSSLIPFQIQNNPVGLTVALKINAGNRTLTESEFKKYLLALGDGVTDQALTVAAYTGGQRIAQLLRATVADYDAKNKTLLLWDGKGRRQTPREHLVVLGTKSNELIEKLVAAAKSAKREALFVGRSSKGETIKATTCGARLSQIATEQKIGKFDLRDIRRTCETMLSAMGINKETRGHVLSHGLSGVQATHYDRHDYLKEKRQAITAWEAHLDRLTKGNGGKTNVTPIKKARAA